MDPANDVHVVYSRLAVEIYYKRRVSGLWHGSELVTNFGGSPQDPEIASDAAGTVHVVYADSRSGTSAIYYRARDAAGWSAEVCLPDTLAGAHDPAIAVEASGDVHVAWADRRDTPAAENIYYKCRRDGMWQADQCVSGALGSVSRDPAIAVDSDGGVHVVWQDSRTDGGDLYYRRWTAGGWGDEAVISSGPGSSHEPALGTGPSGAVHLVWSEDVSGNDLIHYSYWNGTGWSLPLPISASPGPAANPDAAVGPAGNVHVVWEDSRGAYSEIYYKRREMLPGAIADRDTAAPGQHAATQAWCAPNPCRTHTHIWFDAPGSAARPGHDAAAPASRDAALLRARIFDTGGRCVRILQASPSQAANGALALPWDGRDQRGRAMPAGTYYYRVDTPAGEITGAPIILLR